MKTIEQIIRDDIGQGGPQLPADEYEQRIDTILGQMNCAELLTRISDAVAEIGGVPGKRLVYSGPVSVLRSSMKETLPATVLYTNYRGETAERKITPIRPWYGSTDWHPEPQWLLRAFDHEKDAERDFALKDFGRQDDAPRAQALEEALKLTLSVVKLQNGNLHDDINQIISKAEAALSSQPVGAMSFQSRVEPWLNECFGKAIAIDRLERCDRFIEEALELIQSIGYSPERAHALVDYVFGRPAGEPFQEVGGVEVTLASLCLAVGIDKDKAGETELARIWTKVEKIRAKQAAKPTGSALPGPSVRDPDLVQHRLHWEGEEKPTEWREGDGAGLYPDTAFLRIEVRKLYAGGQ